MVGSGRCAASTQCPLYSQKVISVITGRQWSSDPLKSQPRRSVRKTGRKISSPATSTKIHALSHHHRQVQRYRATISAHHHHDRRRLERDLRKFPPLPNLYKAREARVYYHRVGSASFSLAFSAGSTVPAKTSAGSRLGRCGKAAGLSRNRRLCCERAARWGVGLWCARIGHVEDRKDKILVASQPPKPRRRKLSKAELREQAEAAFRAWGAGQTSKDK